MDDLLLISLQESVAVLRVVSSLFGEQWLKLTSVSVSSLLYCRLMLSLVGFVVTLRLVNVSRTAMVEVWCGGGVWRWRVEGRCGVWMWNVEVECGWECRGAVWRWGLDVGCG